MDSSDIFFTKLVDLSQTRRWAVWAVLSFPYR